MQVLKWKKIKVLLFNEVFDDSNGSEVVGRLAPRDALTNLTVREFAQLRFVAPKRAKVWKQKKINFKNFIWECSEKLIVAWEKKSRKTSIYSWYISNKNIFKNFRKIKVSYVNRDLHIYAKNV